MVNAENVEAKASEAVDFTINSLRCIGLVLFMVYLLKWNVFPKRNLSIFLFFTQEFRKILSQSSSIN